MSETRAFLLAALRDVIAGGDVTNTVLYAAIPAPEGLRGAERKAWYGLSYWADDEDIREKDPKYASRKREHLAILLADLERQG